MSVFGECFLFLRAHDGGVEDLARMKAAGFGGVFCNIGDASTPDMWSVVRQRAEVQGMFCGPWLRTADAHNNWDPGRLDKLVQVADDWGSPFIVNSESEIDGSGHACTREIADAVGDREAAVSTLANPMTSVSWVEVGHLPVLPQMFPPDIGYLPDVQATKELWHAYGVRCVYMTYASYRGMTPDAYPLQAPYSIYTGDDCGYDYAAWSPTSSGYEGCVEQPVPPVPPDGGDMEKIGKQHGITGFANWLRAQPDAPQRGPSYDPEDVDTWPWPDKIERTLNILAADHDETASVFDDAV